MGTLCCAKEYGVIYVILAVGVAFLAMFGALKVEDSQRKAAVAQRDEAVTANKALAASIDGVRKECQDATAKLKTADAKRQAATKKAKADSDKLTAAQKDVIAKLAAQAADPAPQTDECKAAKAVLHQYAVDALK